MSDPKICIALVGPPGSGKSCIRRALVVSYNIIRQISHDWPQHGKFEADLLPSTVVLDFLIKDIKIDNVTYAVEVVWNWHVLNANFAVGYGWAKTAWRYRGCSNARFGNIAKAVPTSGGDCCGRCRQFYEFRICRGVFEASRQVCFCFAQGVLVVWFLEINLLLIDCFA